MALGCFPQGWVYLDSVPRSNLVTDTDSFDRYYEPVNARWEQVRNDDDSELEPFVSRSAFVRAGPVADRVLLHGAGRPADDRRWSTELAEEHLDRWLAGSTRPSRCPPRSAPRWPPTDQAIRRNIAERDPANVMGDRFFGPETTQRLVRALWGGDRELPAAPADELTAAVLVRALRTRGPRPGRRGAVRHRAPHRALPGPAPRRRRRADERSAGRRHRRRAVPGGGAGAGRQRRPRSPTAGWPSRSSRPGFVVVGLRLGRRAVPGRARPDPRRRPRRPCGPTATASGRPPRPSRRSSRPSPARRRPAQLAGLLDLDRVAPGRPLGRRHRRAAVGAARVVPAGAGGRDLRRAHDGLAACSATRRHPAAGPGRRRRCCWSPAPTTASSPPAPIRYGEEAGAAGHDPVERTWREALPATTEAWLVRLAGAGHICAVHPDDPTTARGFLETADRRRPRPACGRARRRRHDVPAPPTCAATPAAKAARARSPTPRTRDRRRSGVARRTTACSRTSGTRVEFSSDLVAGKPKKVKVLGQQLVLYRKPATAGRSRCPTSACTAARRCPAARSRATASSARTTAGSTSPNGEVQKIPAHPDKGIPRKARIDSYPVVEKHMFVWVFMGDLPEEERPPIPDWSEFDDTETYRGRHRRVPLEVQLRADPGERRRHRAHAVRARRLLRQPGASPRCRSSRSRPRRGTARRRWSSTRRSRGHLGHDQPATRADLQNRPPVPVSTTWWLPNMILLDVGLPMGKLMIFDVNIPIDEKTTLVKFVALRTFFKGKWADRDASQRVFKVLYAGRGGRRQGPPRAAALRPVRRAARQERPQRGALPPPPPGADRDGLVASRATRSSARARAGSRRGSSRRRSAGRSPSSPAPGTSRRSAAGSCSSPRPRDGRRPRADDPGHPGSRPTSRSPSPIDGDHGMTEPARDALPRHARRHRRARRPHRGPAPTAARSASSPRRCRPAPVGTVRVFHGDGASPRSSTSASSVPPIGLDSHMVFAFTPADGAVPHFTLDSVHGQGSYAFHLDLIPRADLATHLAYVDWAHTPLTATYDEVVGATGPDEGRDRPAPVRDDVALDAGAPGRRGGLRAASTTPSTPTSTTGSPWSRAACPPTWPPTWPTPTCRPRPAQPRQHLQPRRRQGLGAGRAAARRRGDGGRPRPAARQRDRRGGWHDRDRRRRAAERVAAADRG